jgi:predicted RNase H-like HicB family nuclease
MRPFTYAVKLAPDKLEGGYVVTCRDLPEAITQGETLEEALADAADALDEAVAGRISDTRNIPMPTEAKRAAVDGAEGRCVFVGTRGGHQQFRIGSKAPK